MIKNFVRMTLGVMCYFVLFYDCEGMNLARIFEPVVNQKYDCYFSTANFPNQNPNNAIERKSNIKQASNASKIRHVAFLNFNSQKISSLNKMETKNNDDSVPVSMLKTPSTKSIFEKKSVTFEEKLSENFQKLLAAIKNGDIYKALLSGCWKHEFSVEDFQKITQFLYDNDQKILSNFLFEFVKAYHAGGYFIYHRGGQRFRSSRDMISSFMYKLAESKQIELLQMLIQADVDYRKTLSDSDTLKKWYKHKYTVDYLICDKKFGELKFFLEVLERIFPNLSLKDLAYPSGVNWFDKRIRDFPELQHLSERFIK